jgi:hypothetical protein
MARKCGKYTQKNSIIISIVPGIKCRHWNPLEMRRMDYLPDTKSSSPLQPRVTRWVCVKFAQTYLAQPIVYLNYVIHKLNYWTKMCATSIIFMLRPKANNHPLCENSPNLVALHPTDEKAILEMNCCRLILLIHSATLSIHQHHRRRRTLRLKPSWKKSQSI